MASLKHHCGVFGISGHPQASRVTVAGLHALQHRGEESAGVITNTGRRRLGRGLVSDVFVKESHLDLSGTTAVGHVRYATMGGDGDACIQPLQGKGIALAHNGTLTNIEFLRAQFGYDGPGDTGAILDLYQGGGLDDFVRTLRCIEGAWSIVAIVDGCLVVGRDANGFRPLVLGEIPLVEGDPLQVAVVAASETTALDYVNAKYVSDVQPGEVRVFRDGKEVLGRLGGSYACLPLARTTQCVFEHVYFARPDSYVFGHSVHEFREQSGVQLAHKAPANTADLVIAVPDSGVPAAVGYARASGLPYGVGFVRSHYVGRTFISPSGRESKVRQKLAPIQSVVAGRKVVVVDDSLVRGTTSRSIVRMLREAGALEVHLRIASPPVIGPCYYGIDTPSKAELLATERNVEAMTQFLGCDSLAFLEVEDFPHLDEGFCTACFTGDYPVKPCSGT